MELKVADFGLSRECFATAAMTRVAGVPYEMRYASPAIAEGAEGRTESDEGWALGVCELHDKRKQVIDQIAAVLILQSYLDQH